MKHFLIMIIYAFKEKVEIREKIRLLFIRGDWTFEFSTWIIFFGPKESLASDNSWNCGEMEDESSACDPHPLQNLLAH